MKTILCYGDSNTFGYNPTDGGRYAYDKRWTTILGKLLGNEYLVIPEGLNGRTTAFDRPESFFQNGYPYLAPCLTSHKPLDTVVIMLGTNDCNVELGLAVSQIGEGMELLVKTVRDTCMSEQGFIPNIILVAPAAVLPDYKGTPFEDQLDDKSIEKTHLLAGEYKKIADKYGCTLLDCTNALEVSKLDCEHLTEAGHKQLAEMLYKTLKCDIVYTSLK